MLRKRKLPLSNHQYQCLSHSLALISSSPFPAIDRPSCISRPTMSDAEKKERDRKRKVSFPLSPSPPRAQSIFCGEYEGVLPNANMPCPEEYRLLAGGYIRASSCNDDRCKFFPLRIPCMGGIRAERRAAWRLARLLPSNQE